MENQEQNDGQLKIELTPEVAEGIMQTWQLSLIRALRL